MSHRGAAFAAANSRLQTSGSISTNQSSKLIKSTLVTILLFSTFALASKSEPLILNYLVTEDIPIGTYIGNVFIDSGLNRKYTSDVTSQLEFVVVPREVPYLRVDMKTGQLTTTDHLDREGPLLQCRSMPRCEIRLDVAVKPAQYFEIIRLVIGVIDVNDNAPEFKNSDFYLSIAETVQTGTTFALPTATDLDNPAYGVHKYFLQPEREDDDSFQLNSELKPDGLIEPKLVVVKPLDRETSAKHRFKLLACESTVRPQCASIDVIVLVLDSNDNSPIFEQQFYEVKVSESTLPGTTILTLSATDLDGDLNGKVRYELSEVSKRNYGSIFSVETNSGNLVVTGSLDSEKMKVYRLSVIARDQGADSRHSEVPVTVFVKDENDNAPIISVSSISLDTLIESLDDYKNQEFKEGIFKNGDISPTTRIFKFEENTEIGSFIVHVTAFDFDSEENNRISCSQDHPSFKLVPFSSNSGGSNLEYQLLTNANFDVEEFVNRNELPLLKVTLTCRDFPVDPQMASLTSNETLYIYFTDVNDHHPQIQTTSHFVDRSIFNNSTASTQRNSFVKIFKIAASDGDATEKNSRLSYSASTSSFSSQNISIKLDSQSGEVFMSADKSAFENTNFLCLNVNVSDSGSPSLWTTASVSIMLDPIENTDTEIRFPLRIYQFYIEENLNIMPHKPLKVGQVIAFDITQSCSRVLNDVDYRLVSYESRLPFFVDPNSGEIYLVESLDREKQSAYEFNIHATKSSDSITERRETYTKIRVNVIDLNDNVPEFINLTVGNDISPLNSLDPILESTESHVVLLPPQDLQIDEALLRITAVDRDEGENGVVRYKLNVHDASRRFHIDSETGELFLRVTETQKNGSLQNLKNLLKTPVMIDIVASDRGSPSMSDEARIFLVLNTTDSIRQFKEIFLDQNNLRNSLFGSSLDNKKSLSEKNSSFNFMGLRFFEVVLMVGILCLIIIIFLIIGIVALVRCYCKSKRKRDKMRQAFKDESKDFIFRKKSSKRDKTEKMSEHLANSLHSASVVDGSLIDLSLRSLTFDADRLEESLPNNASHCSFSGPSGLPMIHRYPLSNSTLAMKRDQCNRYISIENRGTGFCNPGDYREMTCYSSVSPAPTESYPTRPSNYSANNSLSRAPTETRVFLSAL